MRLPVGLGSLERQRDVRQFPSTLSFSFFCKILAGLVLRGPHLKVGGVSGAIHGQCIKKGGAKANKCSARPLIHALAPIPVLGANGCEHVADAGNLCGGGRVARHDGLGAGNDRYRGQTNLVSV